MQYFIDTSGWRATHIGMGIFCVATMLPLAFFLRRRAPAFARAFFVVGHPTAASKRNPA